MKNIILILSLLVSLPIMAQFPEGFETSVPPAGWVTFIGANGLGTAQNWQASNISNTGTQSAYVRYENVSGGLAQDWLVTPQFTPTSSTNILSFMQRQSYTTDYGSVYKVFVSTGTQTVHADFVLVDTQTEADFTYYYTERQVDLSAYIGTPIYVAFVMEQDDGDNWLIDDVDLTSLPTCDPPTALTVSNLMQTSALVSWTASGTQTAYNLRLYAGTDASTTPVIEELGLSGSLVDSGSYLSGLTASTQYYFT
ncbi:MAG: T9SS C-terminal target domain-containing protein, partial [Flavobacteriaceae bacterium]|nr:T9SS C-terminal target domain-containing protein [Flavobacteriaceae bacterium]